MSAHIDFLNNKETEKSQLNDISDSPDSVILFVNSSETESLTMSRDWLNKESEFVRGLIDGTEEGELITIPENLYEDITWHNIKLIKSFIEMDMKEPLIIKMPINSTFHNYFSKEHLQYADFIDYLKRDHGEEAIFSLFLTANFLDIQKITFLCGAWIAEQIEGLMPAEIMEKYNLEKKSENIENHSKNNE